MISRQPFVLIRLRMIHEQVYRENIGSDIMILSIKSMLKRETRTVYRNLVAEKRKKTTIIGTSYPPSHHTREDMNERNKQTSSIKVQKKVQILRKITLA